MVPNDTEWTTEDILSVETGYKATFYRFIENLVSLDLWAELIKNRPYRYGQIFRFGVKNSLLILWFQMIQNGQLKTFYQQRLGIKQQFTELLRIQ